jgi:tetratricopeptide (TPR) repeat protein
MKRWAGPRIGRRRRRFRADRGQLANPKIPIDNPSDLTWPIKGHPKGMATFPEIPFNTTFRFDQQLHEVPNSRPQMVQAVDWLQVQARQSRDLRQRVLLYGMIGGYGRILGQLAMAKDVLQNAIGLSQQVLFDPGLAVANTVRLAQVHQWEGQFATADRQFLKMIRRCEETPELTHYLDFAYQQAGKSRFDQASYAWALEYFEKALLLQGQKGNGADRGQVAAMQLAIQTTQKRLKLR